MSQKLLPQNRNPRTFDRTISRRAVLRGAGVVMALPWLESVRVRSAHPRPFPQRFAVMFMGCGINEDHWSAAGNGAAMQLSKTLSPLEALKHKINVIDGLFNKASTGQGIHPAQTGSVLSGAQIAKGAVLHSGISIDQMIANTIGQDTAQSSIVLACEQPMTGYHETNFSMAYSSHISWQSPTRRCRTKLYPSLAFDNLFENRGSLRNLSILDRVKESAETLSRQVSGTDKNKLDEYLTSVREVETTRRGHAQEQGPGRGHGQAQEHRGLHDGAAGQRPAGRPARALPADVRHHRARVPDGQDPRGVAAASLAICRPCTIRSWASRRATTPPRTTTIRTGTRPSRAAT